jgi:hypothetical protein
MRSGWSAGALLGRAAPPTAVSQLRLSAPARDLVNRRRQQPAQYEARSRRVCVPSRGAVVDVVTRTPAEAANEEMNRGSGVAAAIAGDDAREPQASRTAVRR